MLMQVLILLIFSKIAIKRCAVKNLFLNLICGKKYYRNKL
jgi:hypothetical protein